MPIFFLNIFNKVQKKSYFLIQKYQEFILFIVFFNLIIKTFNKQSLFFFIKYLFTILLLIFIHKNFSIF